MDQHQAFGIHGMLILGGWKNETGFGARSGVYASHLPMFMAPHDFQVIMQVTGDAVDKYREFVAHFGDFEIYTFKPQPFSLDELDPAGGPARHSIIGALFRGHFERGGTEIASEVPLDVEQIVHFRRFTAVTEQPVPDQLRYICFGERGAAFLAHMITAPPDFDQILTIEVGSLSNVTDDDLRAGVTLALPDRSNSAAARLRKGDTALGTIWRDGAQEAGSIELTVTEETYLETEDLAKAMS